MTLPSKPDCIVSFDMITKCTQITCETVVVRPIFEVNHRYNFPWLLANLNHIIPYY